MNLKFLDIALDELGKQSDDERLQWGRISLGFFDADTEHEHVVSASVLLPTALDETLGGLQDKARRSAVLLLEAALASLKEASIDELKTAATELEAERSAAEQEELRRAINPV